MLQSCPHDVSHTDVSTENIILWICLAHGFSRSLDLKPSRNADFLCLADSELQYKWSNQETVYLTVSGVIGQLLHQRSSKLKYVRSALAFVRRRFGAASHSAYVSDTQAGNYGREYLDGGEAGLGVAWWQIALGAGATALALGYIGQVAKKALDEAEGEASA